MIAACVLVFVIVTIIQPRFADEANLQVIGLDLSNYGILAIGVGCVILTSGIDLSPGSVVALCSMVSAYLNVNDNVPVGLCIIISIADRHGHRVPARLVHHQARRPAVRDHAGDADRGRGRRARADLGPADQRRGVLLPDPDAVQGGRRAAARHHLRRWWRSLAWVLLERTYIGRQIYAVGGNREAARLAGIPVRGA